MSEQEAFHAAMAADPADRTAKLVYADWLDEHGRADQAARLRWWARAQAHTEKLTAADSLPHWVQRLALVERIRNGIARHGAPPAHGAVIDSALAHAERDALGLASDAERDAHVKAVEGLYDAADAAEEGSQSHRLAMATIHAVRARHPGKIGPFGRAEGEQNPGRSRLVHGHQWLRKRTAPEETAAAGYARADDPTHLAAIEPSNRPQGTVLVKVPNPGPPTPPPAQSNPAPATDKKSAPASGPAFILPQ